MQIRPARSDDADQIGLVLVSANLATFLGAMPEEDVDWSWGPEASAAGWRRTLTEPPPADEIMDVVVDDHRVLGFVWAGRATGRSDHVRAVSQLFVRPTAQGRGLGRRLLAHAAAHVRELGDDSLLIGCAAINPSCGFYRHLGGTEVTRAPLRVDRFATEEIFFGWASLDPLLGR